MIRVYSPTIRRKEMEAVLTCMVEERIGPSSMTQKFCQEMKEQLHCQGGVLSTRTPELSLQLCLFALALPKGSKIGMSALSPMYQYEAIRQAGFEPMLLDVKQDTALVSMEEIEKATLQGMRALIIRETFGLLPKLQDLKKITVPMIEDVSQSYGAVFLQDDISNDTQEDDKGNMQKEEVKAGTIGTFSIMGLEENDIITGGGGAVVFSCNKRMQGIMKDMGQELRTTQILPDLNSSLAYVCLKEYGRNEQMRKMYFSVFFDALKQTRHTTFSRPQEQYSSCFCFPVVLNCGAKEVIQKAAKKDVEVVLAFEDTVIANEKEQFKASCPISYSLSLRTVVFPLYPLLGQAKANTIAKIIGNLP